MSPEGSLTLSASSALKADFGARRLEAPSITVAASERAAGATTASNAGSLTGSLLWNASSGEGRAEFDGTLQARPLRWTCPSRTPCPSRPTVRSSRTSLRQSPVSRDAYPLEKSPSRQPSADVLRNAPQGRRVGRDFNVMLKSPHAGRHEATGRLVTAAGKAYVVDAA